MAFLITSVTHIQFQIKLEYLFADYFALKHIYVKMNLLKQIKKLSALLPYRKAKIAL